MKRKKVYIICMIVFFVFLTGCSANQSPTASQDDSNTNSSSSSNPTSTTSGNKEENNEPESIEIKELKVSFVPSRDPDEIITATEPLKQLLQDELEQLGYKVEKVDISVGTTYETVGEALSAGQTDVGLIPGGTYVLFDDGAEVILTATRAALSNDSDDPKDWNENKPTTGLTDKQATYYRSLLIAGPSEKGKELANKVNNGESLTWEDLNSANWAVMSSSSSAGYIYPTLWMQAQYGKSITDLEHVVQSDSYSTSFARLAAEQADIIVAYADARRDNESKWTEDFGRAASIWDETNVIGVTQPIYNDTVSVSKNSPIMTDELKSALQTAFMNIAQTEAGKEVISIYSHEGYQPAEASDYDGERAAQELIKSMK